MPEKYTPKIAGTDFDFDTQKQVESGCLDVLGQLQHLAKYIQIATSAELIWIGQLEAKDATRIRLRIIYPEPVE